MRAPAFVLALGLALELFRPALAWGQTPDEEPGPADRSELEAELFGLSLSETKSETSSQASSSEGREDIESQLFGPIDSSTSEEAGDAGPGLIGRLQDELEATTDRLAIGGNLFLRLEYRVSESGDLEDFPLVSPSTLDLYLDARPVDRVRTYVRARLAYDFTVAETEQAVGTDPGDLDPFALIGGGRRQTEVFLDQLWIKFDADQAVFFTVGKQRVRWGTGRLWNPTDFLNVQRFDPLALFDPRLGVWLLKVQIPFEDLGANIYAVANFEGVDRLDRVGAALRAEISLSQSEVAVSGSFRKDEPYRFGLDLSTGLGDFELRAEFALLGDVETPFFEGTYSVSEPLEFSGLTARYREDELIPQLVLGADVTVSYGDADQAILGIEYFYNDAGYDEADLYPFLLLGPAISQFAEGTGLVPVQEDFADIGVLEALPPLFQPFYLGRHYLSGFALFPTPFGLEDHTITLTGILNLSDRSAVGRVDHSVRLLPFLSLQSYVNVHFGDRGEFRFGFEVPSDLPVQLAIQRPLLAVGFSLTTQL